MVSIRLIIGGNVVVENNRHSHRDTLRVDGGQVGILEERDKVCLSSLLEGHDGRGLEPEVGLSKSTQSAPVLLLATCAAHSNDGSP